MTRPGPTGGLTVSAVESTLVLVPMRRPLGTSIARLTEAPLLLIDLHTREGVTGRSSLFSYRESAGHAAIALLRDAGDLITGLPAAPAAVRRALEAGFRLLGLNGLVSAVLAGIDASCWDALAVAAGVPLAHLLGAPLRPVPAYNSNGLGLIDPSAAAEEAAQLVAEGFGAIKMRLGRPSPADDLAAIDAVRDAVGSGIALMADFNQALRPVEAHERCHALDDLGLDWIEEPIRHDAYTESARLADALRTPVQIGENFAGPRAMSLALRHRACDLVMPDLERIGGVTGWTAAAALADIAGVPMSSHLFPEFSAHLLDATPTAHWLEYVDWADPILREPLRIVDGHATPPDRPGAGIEWDTDAVARYRVG